MTLRQAKLNEALAASAPPPLNVSRLSLRNGIEAATPGIALALLDALPEAMILCDATMQVRGLNEPARRLLKLGQVPVHGMALGGVLAQSARIPKLGAQQMVRAASAGLAGRKRGEFAIRGTLGLRCRISALAGGMLLVCPRATEPATVPALASVDALTGLADRRAFLARLDAVLGDTKRRRCAVLMLDFRGFRSLNDGIGHAAGDQVLREAAQRLRGEVRLNDHVARVGADEFAVLQSGADSDDRAERLAHRLIARLSEPIHIGGQTVALVARAGYALAPKDGNEAAPLLRRAGLALAETKGEGRAGLRHFEVGMESRAKAQHDIASGLREALAKRQFVLHYQPQVDLATERLTGFEALIRWQHPERGVVPPIAFIPVAEERGLIGPIGEWVLREACHEAAKWPAPLTVSVNVAVAQFANGKLLPIVRDALEQSRLPGWRLEIEITESVLLAQTEATRAQIDAIRALGVRIAVDDFGTGYSSLAQLRSFPFDRLKIDRSFVKELPEGHDSVAIIRAVVELGRALGLAITAEGVENEAQRDGLQAMGCSAAQGYFYGRPEPADSVKRVVARLGM